MNETVPGCGRERKRRSRLPTWGEKVKQFFVRVLISVPPVENQPAEAQTGQQEQRQQRWKPRHVWRCKGCQEDFRLDSIQRLRQHLVGRLVVSEGHIHTRLCASMTQCDRDDLRAILRALMRLGTEGEAPSSSSRVEPRDLFASAAAAAFAWLAA
eukprot:GHVU01035460.1.p2 GENE.GHVU01035460.1~~GHVU01035460.1.p2  ORF type:complete len:155 (+),score=15.84 GHVU01035460.1:974-1438(+)